MPVPRTPTPPPLFAARAHRHMPPGTLATVQTSNAGRRAATTMYLRGIGAALLGVHLLGLELHDLVIELGDAPALVVEALGELLVLISQHVGDLGARGVGDPAPGVLGVLFGREQHLARD